MFAYSVKSDNLTSKTDRNGTNSDFCSDGYLETNAKGEKRTFYCQICMIELNSVETMISHREGVKHLKKEIALYEGEIHLDKKPSIIPVPNPEKIRTKVPKRLHAIVKETCEPVVGLGYIKEYIPLSNYEMEPHYQCGLCGSQGIQNGIFSHIIGRRHRHNYLVKLHQDDPKPYVSISLSTLYDHIVKNAENKLNLNDKITTIRCDESYPWPPGKAPWSLEMGGSGISPPSAVENWGNGKCEETSKEEVSFFAGIEGKKNNLAQNPVGGEECFNSPYSIENPRNWEERERMLMLGSEMIKVAKKGIAVSGSEKVALQSVLATCMCKLKRVHGDST